MESLQFKERAKDLCFNFMIQTDNISVTWRYLEKKQTLPTIAVALWEQHIRVGGPGGAAEGVLIRVSAKVQVQVFCLTWLNSDNIIIKKNNLILYHPSIFLEQYC